MKFYQKLKKIRKENGMSQEDLANQLNVSRQAVSKWENDQGFPETDKLLLISNMFGVSVDYLLKEESSENATTNEGEPGFYVSRETVEGYLGYKKSNINKIAIGIITLILSIIPTFLFEEAKAMIMTFLLIAIGVGILVYNTFNTNRYENVEDQPLLFDPIFIKEFRNKYISDRKKFGLIIVSGILVLIFSILFVVVTDTIPSLADNDRVMAILPIFWSIGVYLIVTGASAVGARNVIANNEKYISEKKQDEQYGWLFGIAAMIFLVIGFVWEAWHPGWVIFPITALIVTGLRQIKN